MHNRAHPGEVLKELYLPKDMSVSEAAKTLGVSRQTLSAIINGRAGIGAEMALSLSKALGTTADHKSTVVREAVIRYLEDHEDAVLAPRAQGTAAFRRHVAQRPGGAVALPDR